MRKKRQPSCRASTRELSGEQGDAASKKRKGDVQELGKIVNDISSLVESCEVEVGSRTRGGSASRVGSSLIKDMRLFDGGCDPLITTRQALEIIKRIKGDMTTGVAQRQDVGKLRKIQEKSLNLVTNTIILKVLIIAARAQEELHQRSQLQLSRKAAAPRSETGKKRVSWFIGGPLGECVVDVAGAGGDLWLERVREKRRLSESVSRHSIGS